MSKILAIYYPQYHEIPENNNSWGKGWTDFTWLKNMEENKNLNLIKPHDDFGYYDLTSYDIRKKQAQTAKEYGIYGFCFYHYWFYKYVSKENNVKCKALYKIAEQMLIDGEPNINFCFIWANESWTKKWNNDREIIFEQKYDVLEIDVIEHFNYLLPFFKTENYIKINNKPVFMIHNIGLITNFKFIKKIFTTEAKKNGYSGIFFIQSMGMNDINNLDEINEDVDGAYENCPNYNMKKIVKQNNYHEHITNNLIYLKETHKIDLSYMDEYNRELYMQYNSDLNDEILNQYNLTLKTHYNNLNGIEKIYRLSKYSAFDIETLYDIVKNEPIKCKNYFRGFMTGFNNSPRTNGKCKELILINKSNLFDIWYKYLKNVIIQTNENDLLDDKFIIINAWNEWGEGMSIEPSNLYGYAFLNIIKRCLIETNCYNIHYAVNILNEKTIHGNIFNYNFYKQYPDLNILDINLEEHYYNYGYYEGRIPSENYFEKKHKTNIKHLHFLSNNTFKTNFDLCYFYNNNTHLIRKIKLKIFTSYRNREENLKIFINKMELSFEIFNKYDFEILVIEQNNNEIFQKTKLWNYAIKNEIKNNDDLIMFNDLDFFASLENNYDYLYDISNEPIHLSAYNEQYNYIMNGCLCKNLKKCNCDYFYNIHLFGGSFMCLKEHILKINGFNEYYKGWGAEDCDIYYRFKEYYNPTRRHGIYNNSDHETSHRYFMNNAYISNNIIFNNYINLSAKNKKLLIESNGYLQNTTYKIDELTITSKIKKKKINFLNNVQEYYVIINITSKCNLYYLTIIIDKFFNLTLKPVKIFILNTNNIELQNIKNVFYDIDNIFNLIDDNKGLIYYNLENILIGNLESLVYISSLNIITHMSVFYSINFEILKKEELQTNNFTHSYYTTLNFENNDISTFENKFSDNSYDILTFIKNNIQTQNIIYDFKNKFNLNDGLSCGNVNLFKLKKFKKINYVNFYPEIVFNDIVFSDISHYTHMIFIWPFLVKNYESINKNNEIEIQCNFVKYTHPDINNYFNNKETSEVLNWINNYAIKEKRLNNLSIFNETNINLIISSLIKKKLCE
jgi:hypothetical protein